MSETRYSHDQKERAYNTTKEHFLNLGIKEWKFSSYTDLINNAPIDIIRKYDNFLEVMNTPYLPEYTGKKIVHPLDIEYFKQYPAPIMELVHSAHYTNLNSTISFFGPMLYYFARAIGVEQVLEVGVAEGYTSWYLAHAVKDNATRYNMQGNMYYGVDILDRSEVVAPKLKAAGLPHKLIQMDSINLTPETFKDVRFDLIFQDGAHDDDHVLYELETLYPQLKGDGTGYWIAHDVVGPSHTAFQKIHKMIKDGKYNFQYVDIGEIYGLGIYRKMDGYDYEKKRWTN